jgi:hypothetical protein
MNNPDPVIKSWLHQEALPNLQGNIRLGHWGLVGIMFTNDSAVKCVEKLGLRNESEFVATLETINGL